MPCAGCPDMRTGLTPGPAFVHAMAVQAARSNRARSDARFRQARHVDERGSPRNALCDWQPGQPVHCRHPGHRPVHHDPIDEHASRCAEPVSTSDTTLARPLGRHRVLVVPDPWAVAGETRSRQHRCMELARLFGGSVRPMGWPSRRATMRLPAGLGFLCGAKATARALRYRSRERLLRSAAGSRTAH